MKSRIGPIAYKETLHIVRDWRTLAIAVVLPLVLLVIFGYGIQFDVEDIRVIVYDQDKSPQSRNLIEALTANPTFTLYQNAQHPREIQAALDAGQAALALDIPPGFGSKLAKGETADLQVVVDGAENNTGMLAMSYLQAILTRQGTDITMDRINKLGVSDLPGIPPVILQSRFWYNEELESATYIVPGIIVLVMMLLCTLLTSQTIVRERERGTMEQLIATPVKSYEIVIGKMLPYFVLGVFDTFLIAAAGVFLFGVPLRGSLLLLFGFSSVFALVGLGIGLLISAMATNQVFALQLAIISQMLPTLMLSGIMFPIKEMPVLLQFITNLIAARWATSAMRGIFLKGTGMAELWPFAVILILFAIFFLTAASKRFHKRLE